jgi:hypothetical protein
VTDALDPSFNGPDIVGHRWDIFETHERPIADASAATVQRTSAERASTFG